MKGFKSYDKFILSFFDKLINDPSKISGLLQGKILEMIPPSRILEIGTYTGYSAIALSKGLKPNGRLDTVEKERSLGIIINKSIELTKTKIKSLFIMVTSLIYMVHF